MDRLDEQLAIFRSLIEGEMPEHRKTTLIRCKSSNLIEICLLGLLKLFLQEDNNFFYVSTRCHAQNDAHRLSAHFHVGTVLLVRNNRDKMMKMD